MTTSAPRNGAQALIRTLVDSGVRVCFANPGTSEMHFVAALDAVPEMRGVLALFEGVVTGAADGYARMADQPAATLLHLGPGLANGLANLHNARRAHTPVVNVIGDHAGYHKGFDAPLESDIGALTGWTEGWSRTTTDPAEIGADAAAAVAAAQAGQIANLVLPADVSWGEGGVPAAPAPRPVLSEVDDERVAAVAEVLRSGESTVLLLGAGATREAGLLAASRISVATGVKLFAETFPARIERGAGLPAVDRLGYLAEQVQWQLTDVKHLVLVGAKAPVSFFAYPGKVSELTPEGCQVHTLASLGEDTAGALAKLAEVVAADTEPVLQEPSRPALPSGDLTPQNWTEVIGALLPERAIIADEANTSGLMIPMTTAGAPRHDVLTLTGGSIGYGLPVAVGAAVACPDRPVICLQSDGSAMYTISALWTMARENLDVTTVLLNNRAYAILRMELMRVGVEGAGPQANSLLDLARPDLDFVSIARGMGVPATRATTAEELAEQFAAALAEPGPHLIEAMVPSLI
ncbi:acetolactate synthase large subunit [Actinokineospora sp. NBRC 105648]|uniref:acetolactate synthase large subunit n=1 Tax=Actinokineospora sp. NBRC 105648 TaxID=3032206 RepID=UPI0024A19B85|nr:acetolactate synthase large subunit [Actinokineospora sp. NBRC 105648]GLZ39556.1 acetolactate synthase I/II/III large subunit [Actinokineospora sp. NBRC 105648]